MVEIRATPGRLGREGFSFGTSRASEILAKSFSEVWRHRCRFAAQLDAIATMRWRACPAGLVNLSAFAEQDQAVVLIGANGTRASGTACPS